MTLQEVLQYLSALSGKWCCLMNKGTLQWHELLRKHSPIPYENVKVVGQCDDDVLIFVSADDKAVWTSLGLVTKRYLSDDAVNAVTSRAESYFRKGDYTAGLQYMIDSYTTLLKGDPLDLNS
ncbi:hypothetical protein OSTOST_02918, partial [Ostertagia ostertagi]